MVSSRSRPCDEATIRATLATGDCGAAAKPWVLLVAILASSISYIDEPVVNIALPAIETDLGASVVVIQWLVNAYTLTLSAFLLLGGAAGDHLGLFAGEPGNVCLRKTAWWGWEDSNFKPNGYWRDTSEPGLASLIYRRSDRGSCTRCSVFLRVDRSFRPFRAFS
jgi:hypothetical protein